MAIRRRGKIMVWAFLALFILILLIAAAVMLFRWKLISRFVPSNLLETAPNRISAQIKLDSGNPLQKQVSGGVVEGFRANTEDVQIYLGIPYAAPPVGDLRWKPAQDVVPWDGVLEAKSFAPNPIQGDNEIKPSEYGAECVPNPEAGYSEDCLYLNVWTNAAGSNMPVVFYIPGGAWVGGSNSVENYDGEYLASQNVVFVSINYRLGIFGWLGADVLAREDANGSTGNYGFTDILKALEWVQNNIASFGGNPNQVTLYGGSAGGNLIDLLMISPQAEGLFHRAVSMSYPLDMISPAWDRSFKVSHGNKVIPNVDTLEKLRSMSVRELYSVDGMLSAYTFSGPAIDGYYIDQPFCEALLNGRGKHIDYITGFNFNDTYPGTGDAQFISMIGEIPEALSEGDVLRVIYHAVANARNEGGAVGNTYLLQFEHPTPGPDQTQGAVHGGDLPYMLQYFSENRSEYWSKDDYRIGELASAYLINFCRTGDPNGSTVDGERLPEWEKSRGDLSYFAMSIQPEMREIDSSAARSISEFLGGI